VAERQQGRRPAARRAIPHRRQCLLRRRLWASEASAFTPASGGDDPDLLLPMRGLVWLGLVGYPGARVDHRFRDGDTIRVGPIALSAHVTAGHTRGCTSWSFPVGDGERTLNVVSACDLGVVGMGQYPEQKADLDRSFRVLRSLPADIWVTCHARKWGRYRNSGTAWCIEALGRVRPVQQRLRVLRLGQQHRQISASAGQ
jgi:glyoxylase-like metal-dependent hydrolase (beta-lactamase superfamily II)